MPRISLIASVASRMKPHRILRYSSKYCVFIPHSSYIYKKQLTLSLIFDILTLMKKGDGIWKDGIG